MIKRHDPSTEVEKLEVKEVFYLYDMEWMEHFQTTPFLIDYLRIVNCLTYRM